VINLAEPKVDNLGLRTLLCSKEMAKSCILFNLGKDNLANGDLLSSGTNFYYSLFHGCLSVISILTNEIPVEDCVIDKHQSKNIPSYYIPLRHPRIIELIRQQDVNLANELDALKKIREYLSYGPNVLVSSGKDRSINNITIYCCRFPNLDKDIRRLEKELPNQIIKCCNLIKKILSEHNFHFFKFYFYQTVVHICRQLKLPNEFIFECQDLLESFDKEGVKKLANNNLKV